MSRGDTMTEQSTDRRKVQRARMLRGGKS